MGKLTGSILLADANVLIDYLEAAPEILTLATTTIAPVYVLRQVLDETDALSVTRARRLGLEVIDPPTEYLTDAGAIVSGPLSFQDRLCLISCEREGWTCLTNDQALIRRCEEKNVATKRGLRLLIDLVEEAQLRASRAIRIAKQIGANNPHHITDAVVAEFARLLRGR